MKKFEYIWEKANEEAKLKYDPRGTLAWGVFLKEALEKRIEPLFEMKQQEITKLKTGIDLLHGLLDERNEEVLQTVKRLNEAQSEIPEVPQFVADWYEENKGSLDYMIFETCRDLTDEYTDEFENWFGYNENKAITTLVNMKNGYTVAKEKRFYLKNKLTGGYIEQDCYNGTRETYNRHDRTDFTQQEIDSMETGSYEQIEVEE
ncbi:DUF1642 domain-containing protein [Lactococcus garvieae]|uniref:DUF1642 domain-containing protein n=1 Tax=Lactococcus garvieae TaxID=1363 RepID=UPI003853F5E3